MTHRNTETLTCAAALYEWLVERNVEDIPTCTEIGALLEVRLPWKPDGHRVYQAMVWLHSQNMIAVRHSRCADKRRGQMAVRMLNGRVFKTAGCPFDAPDLSSTTMLLKSETPARTGLTGVEARRDHWPPGQDHSQANAT
jgi:hypothetical protein